MSDKLHGFVIDPQTAVKNEQGDIVISYTDIDFTGKPIVFLTPFSPTGIVQNIPTVIKVGETHITIRDNNNTSGYKLNVVLADPNLSMDKNKMLAESTLKTKPGELIISSNIVDMNQIESSISQFLTPFWNEGSGQVGSIETMNYNYYDKDIKNNFTSSQNAALNYYQNHLTVTGLNENRRHGNTYIELSNNFTTSYFYTWDHQPCIILTPLLKGQGNVAKNQSVVTKVTQTDFSFASNNKSLVPNAPGGSSVYWLAVHQDIPRFTNNSLDKAFTHIFEHFPEHKDHINEFRQEFENIILKGAEPSAALKAKQFDFIPSHSRAKSQPGEKNLAIAKVAIDVLSLLINIITVGVSISNTAKIEAQTAIAENLESAEASETESLISSAKSLSEDLTLFESAASAAEKLEKLKSIGEKIITFAFSMMAIGVVKSMIVAIYDNFKKSWYKWLTTILTIVAQITALIASAGAAVVAWIARIAKVIGLLSGSAALIIDAKALHDLYNPKK